MGGRPLGDVKELANKPQKENRHFNPVLNLQDLNSPIFSAN